MAEIDDRCGNNHQPVGQRVDERLAVSRPSPMIWHALPDSIEPHSCSASSRYSVSAITAICDSISSILELGIMNDKCNTRSISVTVVINNIAHLRSNEIVETS